MARIIRFGVYILSYNSSVPFKKYHMPFTSLSTELCECNRRSNIFGPRSIYLFHNLLNANPLPSKITHPACNINNNNHNNIYVLDA